MPFHCKHCGETFPSEQAKPRCPHCMRITTVVAVKDAPAVKATRSSRAARVGRPRGNEAPRAGAAPLVDVPSQGDADGPPQGVAEAQGPSHRKPKSGEGIGAPPWPLWVGAILMAANLLAVFGTDFQSMEEGERLGFAATFAALGGAGLALAVRGFLAWRPWR